MLHGVSLYTGLKAKMPTFPSLFAIFIEPLAAVRIVKSYEFRQEIHKISLDEDNILLYIQSPSTSLLQTTSLINYFSDISAYPVNWSKFTILPLNPSG